MFSDVRSGPTNFGRLKTDTVAFVARKKREGFNSPFAALKEKVKAVPEKTKAPPAPPPPPVAAEPADEDALFEQWVGEVKPVRAKGGPARERPTPKISEVVKDAQAQEDAEILAQLGDLVAGKGDFDLADTEEWVEGLAPGVDRKLLRKLKHGDFSVQAHLDLHGLVREAAQREVRAFLRESRAQGRRCVLVIPGRGKGSPDGEPILKRLLIRWLSRGEVGKLVLAFCTALPVDGGAGALYVLLRR